MSARLTDEEVICSFMERRPSFVSEEIGGPREEQWRHVWWKWFVSTTDGELRHMPRTLDLNAIWEVQERLKQTPHVHHYSIRLSIAMDGETWHAKAEQKIAILAPILRPIVEGGAL